MIYNYLKNALAAALLLVTVASNAQTTILAEDFEDGTTCNTNLPAGWATTSSEWFVDPSDVSCGGFVPDCTIGTGGSKLLASDGFGATEAITYGPFSTVGMGTVTVDWNGVRSTGAPVVTFSYSTDGGSTWNNIAFTDVTDDGTWYNLATENGSFISLPAGALGQSSVLLRWEYTCTTGNLYCAFDDVSILGYLLGVYYYKGVGGLHQTTSWTDDITLVGGNAPPNFTSNDQTFYVVNAAAVSLTAAWTVSGSGTRVFVGNGTGNNSNLTIPSGFALTLGGGAGINVSNSSTLTLANVSMPAAANLTLATGSTVDYAHTTQTVTVINKAYSNITLSGTTDKALPNGFSTSGIFNLNGVNAIMAGLANYTLSGTVTGSGAFRSAAARLSILGSGAFGTITFTNGAATPTIQQLTVNRGALGSITLGSNLVVTTFSFTNGTFNIAGRHLNATTGVVAFPTLSANGVLVGSNTTSLSIGSSASALTGSLFMDQTSATTRSMRNITLNRATGTLTMGNAIDIWGTLLPTAGTIASGGNITIKSDATTKGRVGQIGASGNVTGNVTVETFAASGTTGWTTLGVAGVTGRTFSNWNDDFTITCPTCPDGSQVGGVAFTSITGYSEPAFAGDMDNFAHYQDIANITDAITVGKGYWVYLGNGSTSTSAITIDVTGPLAMKSAFGNIALTNTGGSPTEDGWNLIANPYPSPVSWTAVRGGSGTIADAIYAYNPDLSGGTGAFAEYVGGVSSPAVGSGGIDDNIPTGQGFYVQVSGNITLTPVETWKTASASANALLKQASSTAAVGNVFRLNLTGGPKSANYETVFHFNSNATNGHDMNYDGIDLSGADPNAAVIFSKMNNNRYRINGLPSLSGNVSIPVGVISGYSGSYTITPIDVANLPAGACVNLYDKFTNTTHNLVTGGFYVFNFSDTTTVERFTLNITVTPGTLTSNVTNPTCNNTNNGNIIASGTSAGPWNYVWKNSVGAVVKTTNGLAAPDTLKNLAAGIFTVEINTVGTCDNATGSFTLASTAPLPVSNFNVNTTTVVIGNPFIFTNNSTNAVSYTWLFGDGNSTTTTSPTYTYANTGNYSVQLIAVSACGDSSTYSTNVQVLSSPLSVANLSAAENISVGKDANGVYVQLNYDRTVKATVSVSNVLGQQLIAPRMVEGSTERFYLDVNVKEQILLITVSAEDKVTTQRVFSN
jgi:PKD repeat protein